MQWYEIVGKVLYYVTLPLAKLVLLIIYLLYLLLSPFIYIGQRIFEICMIPLNIAAKFESLWYFLACAILIGAALALTLHGIFRTFVLVFRLDEKPRSKTTNIPAKGHNVKSYRKAREKRRLQAEKEQEEIEATAQALATSPLLKEALKQMQKDSPGEDGGSPGARIRGKESLYGQTILEQTDEEES